MKLPLSVRIFGLYALTFGAAALVMNFTSNQTVAPLVSSAPVQQVVMQSQPEEATRSVTVDEVLPVKLRINALDMSLEVKTGVYSAETKEWTLDTTNAFFASVSRKLNTSDGTTVIYGHDRTSVFAPLEKIKPGDEVKVTADDGRQFVYAYRNDTAVSPESVAVLYEPSVKPQLVLMTCDGVWSDVRRVMYFDFTGVEDV